MDPPSTIIIFDIIHPTTISRHHRLDRIGPFGWLRTCLFASRCSRCIAISLAIHVSNFQLSLVAGCWSSSSVKLTGIYCLCLGMARIDLRCTYVPQRMTNGLFGSTIALRIESICHNDLDNCPINSGLFAPIYKLIIIICT